MRRAVIVAAASLILSASTALATPGGARTTQRFVTILFGRTQFTTTSSDCAALPNTVNLDQVAAAMSKRGLVGVGTLVVNRTNESGFRCLSQSVLQPDWAWVRARYASGWRFVSAGLNYQDMTTLPPSDRITESCGSLSAFDAHGIVGANALFAYPNNRYTTEIQTDPVSTCFSYGRRYDVITRPNVRSSMHAPWFASVYSVNGGKCNDPAAACYTVTGSTNTTAPSRYASPTDLAAAMSPAAGSWFAVQFYRFVSGTYSNGRVLWDCSSPDWRLHYTSKQELYCFSDFRSAMDALRQAAAGGVIVTDPATVASAWHR